MQRHSALSLFSLRSLSRLQQQQQQRISTIALRQYSTDTSSAPALKQTRLHDFHVAHKATMVPYAGWRMPVGYKTHTTTQVHKHCREAACLFDVSHMGQLK